MSRSMGELTERIQSNLGEKEHLEEMEFPKKNLLIEVTNLCNHQCIFCANRKMTRKRGMIDPTLAHSVLRQAYDLGMREVGFYATGEPLVNNRLEEYVAAAAAIGYEYIYLTTNGALADRLRMERLIAAGLNSVKFSVNAIEREKYLLIHGKDELETVDRNLTDLWNYRKESGRQFKIYVSYVATRYTNETEEKICQYFRDRCDDIKVLSVGCQHGLTIENKKYLMLDERLSPPIQHSLPCNLVFHGVYVTWEGYLTACCSDFQNYLTYADLNSTSLKEAWNCEQIKSFRARHVSGTVAGTLCHNCANECSEAVWPLKEELATVFGEEMYSVSEMEERIRRYEKGGSNGI